MFWVSSLIPMEHLGNELVTNTDSLPLWHVAKLLKYQLVVVSHPVAIDE